MKTILEYLQSGHIKNAGDFEGITFKTIKDVDTALFQICKKYREDKPSIQGILVETNATSNYTLKYIEWVSDKNISNFITEKEFRQNVLFKGEQFLFHVSYFLSEELHIVNGNVLKKIGEDLAKHNINGCSFADLNQIYINNEEPPYHVLLHNLHELDILLSTIKKIL